MNPKIAEIFQNESFVNKVKNKLPKLFHLAELESSRAGKIGMEVGSVREKIITSLFLYKFGQEHVQTELPITESEKSLIENKKTYKIPIDWQKEKIEFNF